MRTDDGDIESLLNIAQVIWPKLEGCGRRTDHIVYNMLLTPLDISWDDPWFVSRQKIFHDYNVNEIARIAPAPLWTVIVTFKFDIDVQVKVKSSY